MKRIAALLLLLLQCACASAETMPEGMVRIPARPGFTFAADLTNTGAGEASPILQDYYISATKVTNAEYKRFIDATGHKAPNYWTNAMYPDGKADHPVVAVSCSDAMAYCSWLTEQHDGWIFRLPTEAEWENAARADLYDDPKAKYPGVSSLSYDESTMTLNAEFNYNGVIAAQLMQTLGTDYILTYNKGDYEGQRETLGECIAISKNGGVTNWANHGGNARRGYFLQTDLYAEVSSHGGNTTPVGSYPPNALGLYDMAGNCWDLTSSLILANNGLERGVECYAVRGGSWYATSRSCTMTYRGEGRNDHPSATVGFRVAADAP